MAKRASARRRKGERTVGKSDWLALLSWGAVASFAVILAVAAWRIPAASLLGTTIVSVSPGSADPIVTGSIPRGPESGGRPAGGKMEIGLSPGLERATALQTQLTDLGRELAGLKRTLAMLTQRHDKALDRIEQLEKRTEDITGSIPSDGSGSKIDTVSPKVVRSGPVKMKSSGGRTDDTTPTTALVLDPKSTKTAPRTRFGLDLGDYKDLATLRVAWLARKKEFPENIGNLSVLAKIIKVSGERKARLIAGPFDNAADAITLCAQVKVAGHACRPTQFEGQLLSAN